MSEEATNSDKSTSAPTAEQVKAYLKRHPNFLHDNPELVETLKAPQNEMGDSVVDLQHFMVGGLQKQLREMRDQYDDILDFCRDNQSTQTQVHNAIISLVKCRDLEQLLQVLTADMVPLFDLDVVRIAMETDHADMFDTSYPDAHYSGISFVMSGTADAALGGDSDILMVEDTEATSIIGFEEIFSDCISLVKSCALLRLRLDMVQRDVLLCLGV
ncbi:MAG: DUF484 family protein, partial [Alphaproteobacteria bacterium]|nr:DUF484 family protein [Alphaproteobacteria bacterium]